MHSHLRHLIIASAFIVASGLLTPASAQDGFSQGIDRPGGDYRNFAINGDAQACREVCERERGCRAWTWVKPGVQGQSARCWLKNVVPKRRANSCCTSGVTGGQRID
jgi:hypothetical protein